MKIWDTLSLFCITASISACNVLPYDTGTRSNSFNQTPTPVTALNEKLSKEKLPGNENNKTFIGVALSGGGSRAANFSMAVLWQLEKEGLLPPSTVISSVSGGSLAAAYYALHRHDAAWGTDIEKEKIRKHFQTDLQSRWEGRMSSPANILYYWFTPYDRSDIMKDVLDGFLKGPMPGDLEFSTPVNHAQALAERKRFRDIPLKVGESEGFRLFINSTTLDGRNFVFTNQIFEDLGSNLADYPIADAVMASGAFPGAFNCVTLERYTPLISTENPQIFSPSKSFQDGILPFRSSPIAESDLNSLPDNQMDGRFPSCRLNNSCKNLLTPNNTFVHLMDGGASDNLGVRTLLRTLRKASEEKYDHCIIYLVDSYLDPLDMKWSRQASALSTLEDDRRRFTDYILDSNAFVTFDTLLSNNRNNELAVLNYPSDLPGTRSFWETNAIQATGNLSCQIWHLTFQRLTQLAGDIPNTDEKRVLRRIARIANETKTAYRLDSSATHDASYLQDNLFAAAEKLVNLDVQCATDKSCLPENNITVKKILLNQYEKWGVTMQPHQMAK